MKALFTLATVAWCLLGNAVYQPGMDASGRQMAANPGPHSSNSLVYDAQQHKVILLTGSNQAEREDVWSWDGKQWQVMPGAGPTARGQSSTVYDTRRQRIILYGGIGNKGDFHGDTWEWDGKRWLQMTDTSVGARDHHAMAYDEARGKTVLFGGINRRGSSRETWEWPSETWEWDGSRWTQLAVPGPGARVASRMVYDSKRKQVILFGGGGKDGKRYNDTWAWDGKNWQKISDVGPPASGGHAMTFDRRAGVILLYLYGGTSEAEQSEDLWQWDGRRWTEIKVTGPKPSKRIGAGMAYDAANGKTILYGGLEASSNALPREARKFPTDTWEWDGRSWHSASMTGQ